MGEPLDWFFCFCSAFILGYPQATPITEKHRSLVASKNAMCLIFFSFFVPASFVQPASNEIRSNFPFVLLIYFLFSFFWLFEARQIFFFLSVLRGNYRVLKKICLCFISEQIAMFFYHFLPFLLPYILAFLILYYFSECA